MHLFLIRHGETVDNVSGLYAGVKDSQLTNHGVEQITRLGRHFAGKDIRFTHIFASPLSRAFRTAEAVRKAQPRDGTFNGDELEVVKVPELIERNFGFYEGKSFHSRADEPQGERDRATPGFVEVETKESMARRVDTFLDAYLLPLLEERDGDEELVVAVVAHGMLLSDFWRRLLLRLPRQSLTIAPEIMAKRSGVVLEYLGGWSNTGYMELSLKRTGEGPAALPGPEVDSVASSAPGLATTLPTPIPPPVDPADAEVLIRGVEAVEHQSKSKPRVLRGWSTNILAVDSTVHLLGLKRQRGGIGSLAHDEGQRKLESFFKKPKLS